MKALITGITGQDGSYLAELLFKKGYEVYGIVRRGSTIMTSRIDHLVVPEEKIHIEFGDLADTNSIVKLIKEIEPDEIYNMGSMSQVRVSFDIPEYTGQVTGLGVTRILEALRALNMKKTKFYQASSSEMYGISPAPQNENTPFRPVSPYGCAKLYGYHMTQLYRTGYGMFACNGILFNHESILKNSPVIIKDIEKFIDIIPIEDMFRTDKHKYEGLLDEYKENYIWNGLNWTKILNGTCYQDNTKNVRLIQTRESCYEATNDHISFDMNDNEIKTKDWKENAKVFKIKYPEQINLLTNDKDFAKFLGYLVGDGHIDKEGGIRLIGCNKKELIKISNLILKKYPWKYRLRTFGPGKYNNCKKDVWQLDICNDSRFGLWIRKNIYTVRSNEKRIPKFILNATKQIKKAFFDGYYLADGRNNGNERYKYKGFTTKSATLCLGLNCIFKSFSNQEVKTKCELRDGKRYYYTQYRTSSITGSGKHLRKDLNQIIKITDTKSEDGWFYDIQTESQTFATGPNLFKIHNSPRRGETFVTKKIIRGAVRIKLGLQQELKLGNLNSMRDWGFAGDYMDAIYKIMHHDYPDDFVVATEDYHSIQEFLTIVFGKLNIDVNEHIKISSIYYRPNEVPELRGDATKIRDVLGWKPKVSFKQLVDMMIDSVMKEEKDKLKLL